MKRPFKNYRPLGPFAEMNNLTSGGDGFHYLELRLDKDDVAEYLLDNYSHNRYHTEGLENRRDGSISMEAPNMVFDLFDMSYEDILPIVLPVSEEPYGDFPGVDLPQEQELGREMVEVYGNEVSLVFNMHRMDSVYIPSIYTELDSMGIEITDRNFI